jgi:hypothetical protein
MAVNAWTRLPAMTALEAREKDAQRLPGGRHLELRVPRRQP